MSAATTRLAKPFGLLLACTLLLSLSGAGEAPPETPSIVFLTSANSTALQASYTRYREALTTRHPDLVQRLRLRTLSMPANSAEQAIMMREIARERPTLLVAHTGAHAQAARTWAPEIPLVFSSHTDPRELGITSSLDRHVEPATGLWVNDELNAKRLEILLDAYPSLDIVAVIGDEDWYGGIGDEHANMRAIASQRQVELRVLKARSVADALAAIDSAEADGVQGWCLPRTSLSLDGTLVRRLASGGRPVIVAYMPDLNEGAHISYAYDRSYQPKVLADLTARVLSGESPASIPVQTPDRFQLVVSTRTDPRLPPLNPSVVRRADVVVR